MKLGAVVTATDLNPLYADFIPNFIKAWKTLFPDAQVVIAVIANEIPLLYEPYMEFLRLVKPIEGMHSAFQAQCIRLLLPATLDIAEGILITDMDMLPMNRAYYATSIQHLADDAFISYRPIMHNELPMCYCIASAKTWSSMFGISSISTIEERLQKWYKNTNYDGRHGGKAWNTDQLLLYRAFQHYKGPKVCLTDSKTGFHRLCRSSQNIHDPNVLQKVASKQFTDYHCLRPQAQFAEFNDALVDALSMQVD